MNGLAEFGDDGECFVSGGETGEEIFFSFVRSNFDGIGNDFGRFLPRDTADLLPFQN